MITLLLALLATPLSDPQLDAKIASVHQLPLPKRIDELSKLFKGAPYTEFPLGDGTGPEPGARWRTDGFDCQTYVETVLAMANARSLQEAKTVLDDIRYSGAPSFQNRNHFTEAQWLPANREKGYFKDETTAIDGRAPTETLVLRKDQWTKIPGLKRLEQANVPDGSYNVRYLPLAEAKKRASSIENGTILMVVREFDPTRVVRISHMGFVVREGKKTLFRHASTGETKTVLDDELSDFLEKQATYKKWRVVGVALAMPVDASLRVSSLTKQQ